MQIEYDGAEVKKLFNDWGFMQKRIGKELTKAVKKRYDQLLAANSFSIYLSTGLGKPHSLTENLLGVYGVNLTGNYRLIIKPISDDLSAEALKKCDTIEIRGVGDYHGQKNEWLIP